MKLPKINIPDGKNLAMLAIAILLLLYAASRILAYLKKVKTQNTILNQPVNPVNLSFQSGQYKIWADQLQGILEQWPFLDEDQIIKILERLRTTDDYYELIKTFGIRKISRYILGNFEGNLNEWFIHRLSKKELKKVSAVLEGIGIYM